MTGIGSRDHGSAKSVTGSLEEASAAERVVAAQVVLHPPLVGGERALAAGGGAAREPLGDGVGGDPPRLQAVRDALAVERADHPGGVAGEEKAVAVQRTAVEAHRQGGALDGTHLVVGRELPLGGDVAHPRGEQLLVVGRRAWQVEDRSVAGLRISASGGIGQSLVLGALVAIRQSDTVDWVLGAVRRLNKVSNDEVEAGVSIIADRVLKLPREES